MDNLNWEVQGLDVKNRKLWEQNPGTGEHVDHEVELESARTDAERWKLYGPKWTT